MGRKSDAFVLSGTRATTSTTFPVSVRHISSDQGPPPMRRYLLLTLSITSIAALPGAIEAAPRSGAEPAMEVAQAPDGPPPSGDAQSPKRDEEKHDNGGDKGSAPPPAGKGRGQGAPPQQQEHQGRRERGGEQPPGQPPVRQAQPPKGGDREQRRERNRDRDSAPPQSAQPAPEHRERPNRDQGPPRREPPTREAQQPAPPPAQQPPPKQAAPQLPSNRGPDNADRTPPPQQAQPSTPPQAPASPPRDSGRPPVQAGKPDDRGPRGDGDRGPPRDNQPPRQAQPPVPPGTPGAGGPPPLPQAGSPQPGRGPREGRQFGGPSSIEEVKRGRRQRVEEGGKRTITEEPGNRTIIQEKGAPAMIRHDEGERMRRTSRDVRQERRPDGGNLTIAIRPGGIEVFSEFDKSGRLTRRYRRDREGRQLDLIDNRRFRGDRPIILDLAPPRLGIPRDRYIMDYDRSSDDDLYDALMDGPVERLDRGYSLEEIRYNAYLRDRMRRVDLDTVNFDFGAWQVPHEQYRQLERIANTINRILDRRPDEVFLVEGHTDAVGSELDNLTLSDRRAEEVAIILTETFNVPPENLITQGYGEEFLKIPTLSAERANRRVAVRRITPLLARSR